MIHDQTKQYEWDAMEYEHREKSTDWYWALGIAIVVGCILAIISSNYLLAVLIALGGVFIGFYGNDRPFHVHVEISERGIKLDRNLYAYEAIKSFWMYHDHRGHNRLLIVTARPVMPMRIVTLPDDIPATEVRDYLSNFIEEKESKPSTIDLLAEAVGL